MDYQISFTLFEESIDDYNHIIARIYHEVMICQYLIPRMRYLDNRCLSKMIILG